MLNRGMIAGLGAAGLAAVVGIGLTGAAAAGEGVTAIPVSRFLDSIGVNSAIAARGESAAKTAECVRYAGVRWIRSGNEGGVPVDTYLELHKQTGLRFSWGLMSGGTDLPKLLSSGKQLAAGGALLAFEGNNEPNNWGVNYHGKAGGRNQSWVPVAELQRDLYAGVKADPELKSYPVWSITEGGAQTDNTGLQYLAIPAGAATVMPPGTKYADFANVHNYVYHPNARGLEDNKTWKAADPGPACKVDGLFGEYGRTWAKHFPGYSEADLQTLPRVTTETGVTIDGPITEEVQALNILSLYLDQFKRGWSYTALYLLRDRVDEGGNQKFGLYRPDYTPRKAAIYLHNLTTVLSDHGVPAKAGKVAYTIPNEPETVHDLLLQKSDGTFELVVWGERLQGSDNVRVELTGAFPSVKLYDPTVGTTPTSSLPNPREVSLSLSDHPVVLELRGKSR